MNYEPLLSDFDGTVVNSEPVIVASLQVALDDLSIEIPEGTDLRECVGPPLERALPRVLGAHVPVAKIIHRYRSHYMATAPTRTELMPGAIDTLQTCNAAGIRVGIVTYKPLPLVRAILAGLEIDALITLVSAPLLNRPPSSKADLLTNALDRLKPFRADPLFVGDHEEDEAAATVLGVDFLGYPDHSWNQIATITLGG